jgi:hypothetical protein
MSSKKSTVKTRLSGKGKNPKSKKRKTHSSSKKKKNTISSAKKRKPSSSKRKRPTTSSKKKKSSQVEYCRSHIFQSEASDDRCFIVVKIPPRQSTHGGIVSEQAFYKTTGKNSKSSDWANSVTDNVKDTWFPCNGIGSVMLLNHYNSDFAEVHECWIDKSTFTSGCDSDFARFGTREMMQLSEKMGGGIWENHIGDKLRIKHNLSYTTVSKQDLPQNKIPIKYLFSGTIHDQEQYSLINDYIGTANTYGLELENFRISIKSNDLIRSLVDVTWVRYGGKKIHKSIVQNAWNYFYTEKQSIKKFKEMVEKKLYDAGYESDQLEDSDFYNDSSNWPNHFWKYRKCFGNSDKLIDNVLCFNNY